MIPLEKDAMRDLLELKDIALLNELWTFFRLADEITVVLESPPVRSGGMDSGPLRAGPGSFGSGGGRGKRATIAVPAALAALAAPTCNYRKPARGEA